MKKYLKGKVVLVTAGPTRESIDLVRYISNRSSGKMGYALAKAARDFGARVILISGPTSLPEPQNIKTIKVETGSEMLKAILKNVKKTDVLIMAAAVSDFIPAYTPVSRCRTKGKIKRSNAPFLLKLNPTPDILKAISKKMDLLKKNLIKVGFAAETHSLIHKAYQKLKDKGLDIIIANDISRKDIGFESDYNRVYIIKKDKTLIKTKRLKKEKLAKRIISYILDKKI